MNNNNNVLLDVKDLKVYFHLDEGLLKAVDGVDFQVRRQKTLGLVGESGCGKTTLGRCVLRSIGPTAGQVVYHIDDRRIDLLALKAGALRQVRRDMQMIFQDPYASLDPRMSVLDIIGEPLVIGGTPGDQVAARVRELMALVGLDARYMRRYPHAFSGGQRQRIAVARALATHPEFIVCGVGG